MGIKKVEADMGETFLQMQGQINQLLLREFYLEDLLKAAVKANGSLSTALKDIANPFVGERDILSLDQYEEDIFNEARLYKALGKEDAR